MNLTQRINDIFNSGAVNKSEKTSLITVLLLSLYSKKKLDFSVSSVAFVSDLNEAAKNVLSELGYSNLYKYIKISLPLGRQGRQKFVTALTEIFNLLQSENIKRIVSKEDDPLSKFYEVFLRYGEDAKDMGIVLTPTHVTRFAVETLGLESGDKVFDPTCGTGSFLVATENYIKKNKLKNNTLIGVEQQTKIALMAISNMVFKSKNNWKIINDDCFSVKSLDGFDKVFMNPPFALKKRDQKEYRFISDTLKRMKDGGLFFGVIPYSLLTRDGVVLDWRKKLLKENTLLSVVSLPEDLFYPVRKHACAIYLKKGVPHDFSQNVLWARVSDDGFLTKKNTRYPGKDKSDFTKINKQVFDFIHKDRKKVKSIPFCLKTEEIDSKDDNFELVPERYLSGKTGLASDLKKVLGQSVRSFLSFLVEKGLLSFEKIPPKSKEVDTNALRTKPVKLSDIFEIENGVNVDIGNYKKDYVPVFRPTSNIHNLICGYTKKTNGLKIYPKGSLVVGTDGSGSHSYAYVAPVDFVASYNVAVLTPKKGLSLLALFYIATAITNERWRFSYGRKPKINRLECLSIECPVDKNNNVDFSSIDSIFNSFVETGFIKKYFDYE